MLLLSYDHIKDARGEGGVQSDKSEPIAQTLENVFAFCPAVCIAAEILYRSTELN